ncbi:MAG TPA: hypothetical protein VG757_02740 [Devosia sp.]|nr:hypothetical protein [Devosia sp.]
MRLHARHLIAALLLPLSGLPAEAQGLNLGVNLGGAGVNVGVGNGHGVNVGVGVGGTNVNVGVGNGNGPPSDVPGLGLGLFLGGSPDALDNPGGITDGWEVLTQDEAVTAVSNKKILPLDSILVAAKLFTDGEVIDAKLIEVKGFLLYELKVLEADGDVSDLYFYARSGVLVETK